jgi:hypothetical protein
MLYYERVKSLIIPINIVLPRKQRIIRIVKGSVAGGSVTLGDLSRPATVVYIGSVANKNNGIIFRIIVMIYMIFVLEILSV